MGLIEHRMNHHTAGSTSHRFRMVKRLGAAGLAVCVIAVGAWSFIPQDENGIVLYQGEFSEVQLINSMIQQLMEDRYGLEVTIKDQMTSKNNFQALIGDDHSCDLMYNWDGTILTTILGLDTTDIPDGMTLYDFVNQTVQEEYDCRMLGKIGVNNTYAIGVTSQVAEQYNLKTISDLQPVAGSLRFGAEQDFFTDAGSMKFGPFVEFYDLNFKEVLHVDIMLKYKAIEEGSYEVMVVYATDGLNKRANLKILEDDKQFFPEYYGTILARNDLFERFREEAPDLEETLSSLNGLFTNDLMSSMTYEVDVEQRSVDDVAREFLIEQGLLAP